MEAGTSERLAPEVELKELNSRERRYQLGQFFTPEPIALFMAEAVMAVEPTTVCDPGVGGGVLLRAVGPGASRFGCDVDPSAVRLSQEALTQQGGSLEIVEGDFLNRDRWPFSVEEFDAVICNPPYIRHHNLPVEQKALAKHYSALFGAKVSSLSGGYVYFFLEAIRRLRPGGRLVFITPVEFLDVRYGEAVKQVLLDTCEIDDIAVLNTESLAFDGVLTTTAITIATKKSPPPRRVRLSEGHFDGKAVHLDRRIDLSESMAKPTLPWTPLLPSRAEAIAPLLEGRTAKLSDYARVRRGIATGDNKFFCLTQKQVDESRIEFEFLVPVVVGSKDLPENSAALTKEHWETRRNAGARAWLLWCHKPKSALRGTAALRHIERGESEKVNERFNCRSRTPWYSVEQVPSPDFFVTYMSRGKARFVRNEFGARCMTSLLNVWTSGDVAPEDLRPVLEDHDNAQILREFGRTYGGGLGKIEPRDLLELPLRPIQRKRS